MLQPGHVYLNGFSPHTSQRVGFSRPFSCMSVASLISTGKEAEYVRFGKTADMVFTPQNSNPSTHRNPWDPDPSRPDAVGGKNRVFCVCFGKPMLPSVEEELQQWMEDNHVSLLELKSFADRMLKEVAIIPFKVIK